MLLHLEETLQMNHSSGANLKGDEQYIMISHRSKYFFLFLSAACSKRESKLMVSSTITLLFDSSSNQIMSGLRSMQGRWLDSE